MSPNGSTAAIQGVDAEQAVNQYRRALEANPKDIQTRIKLAAVLDATGKGSEAEDVLRTALQQGRREPELFHALGMIYLHHEAFLGAAQAFMAETKLRPNDADAHLKFATALSYGGRAEDAEIEFKRAIRLNSALSDAYLGLAFLNNTTERYQYAVKYLKQYIESSRQKGPGYGLLSRVYLNMHLYDDSVAAGENAVQAMPSNASVWYNLGQAYAQNPRKMDLPGAIRALERSVALSPTGHAHFELANVYLRSGRLAEASTQYEEVIRAEPNNGKAHYQLGQALMRLGRREEANKMLMKAKPLLALNLREKQLLDKLSANPRDSRSMVELGSVYKQLGMFDRARNWVLAALKENPLVPNGNEELADIRRLESPTNRGS